MPYSCHLSAVLVLALICTSTEAETRVWTDVRGRTIKAEFASYMAGTVKLKIPGSDKVYVVPVELLSEKDQEFIRSLAASRRSTAKPVQEVVQFPDEDVNRADRFLAERIRNEAFLAVNIEGKKHFVGDLRSAGFFAAMDIREILRSHAPLDLQPLAKAIHKLDKPGITILLEPVSLEMSEEDVSQALGPSPVQERGTVTTNARWTISESDSRNVRSTRATWFKCAYLAIAATKPDDPANGIVAIDCSAFLRCHPVR
jgi:hypothetical protein